MSADANNSTSMLNPAQITAVAVNAGAYKAQKNQFLSFMSAIPAGAFIAIAFVFYAPHKPAPLMWLGAWQNLSEELYFLSALSWLLCVVTNCSPPRL